MVAFNYENKFKLRFPQDTINVIKKFFEQKNYKIIEAEERYIDISNTWWHGIDLYKDNILILHSNGKGVTKEFSKASGYSELYERFCWNRFLTNSILYKEFYNKSKKIKGYLDTADEIFIDLNNIDYKKYSDISIDDIKQRAMNNTLNEVKYYKNTTDNNYLYLNNYLVWRSGGTNGLAAGNTFEEAYVQGVSEIFERGVNSYIIDSECSEIFNIIDNDSNIINNPNRDIIRLLNNSNIKVTIFDFSYNYNLPVIGLILYYKKNAKFIIGAQPDFNIALERCFTEAFQGREFGDNLFELTLPQNHDITKNLISQQFGGGLAKYIPEKLLLNNRYVKNPSSLWQTFKDINDQVIFCDACAKKNNLNLYYYNISLCKDMTAIKIYCPELKDSLKKIVESNYITQHISLNDITEDSRVYKLLNAWLYSIIYENNSECRLFGISDINNLYKFNNEFSFISNIINFSSLWVLLSNASESQLSDLLLQLNFNDLSFIDEKYLLLYKYYFSNLYSIDEIKKILDNYDINIKDIDDEKIYTRDSVIYNLIISKIKSIIREYIDVIIPDYIDYQLKYDKNKN